MCIRDSSCARSPHHLRCRREPPDVEPQPPIGALQHAEVVGLWSPRDQAPAGLLVELRASAVTVLIDDEHRAPPVRQRAAFMAIQIEPVSYTHLRAHETPEH